MQQATLFPDLGQIDILVRRGDCQIKVLRHTTGIAVRTLRSLIFKSGHSRRNQPVRPVDQKTLELLADALGVACGTKISFSELALVSLDRESTLRKFQGIGWEQNQILQLAEKISKDHDEPSPVALIQASFDKSLAVMQVSHRVWEHWAARLECSREDLLLPQEPHRIKQLCHDLITSIIPNWIHHAMKFQMPSGGFAVSFLGSTSSKGTITQPWSTSQLLTSVLAWKEPARFHTKKIAKVLPYFQKTRVNLPATSTRQSEQGWGLFEHHRWAGTEQSAWVILSQAMWLSHNANSDISALEFLVHEIELLLSRQFTSPHHPDFGGFCPTSVVNAANVRTYSTIAALWAIDEVARLCPPQHPFHNRVEKTVKAAIEWLLNATHQSKGIDPKPLRKKHQRVSPTALYPGLTAQTLWTLLRVSQTFKMCNEIRGFTRLLRSQLEHFVSHGLHRFPSWTFLHPEADRAIHTDDQFLEDDYVQLEGSSFFWLPWSAAVTGMLINKPILLDPKLRKALPVLHDHLVDKIHAVLLSELLKPDHQKSINTCMVAEILFGASFLLQPQLKRRFPIERLESVYEEHPVRAELVLRGLPRTKKLTVEQLGNENDGHISDQNHIGGSAAVIDLAHKARVSSKHHVLDVGCGIGGSARLLAHTFGCRVTGIELTQSRFEDAVLLTNRVGLQDQVSFLQGDYLELELPPSSMDVVWGQSSWIHFDDPNQAVAKGAHLLRKGGRLALDEVVLRWIPKERKILDKLNELEEYWNGSLSTAEVWKSSCQNAQLSVESIEFLTPTLKTDMMKLWQSYSVLPPASVQPTELRAVELALAMIELQLITLMRLVAIK